MRVRVGVSGEGERLAAARLAPLTHHLVASAAAVTGPARRATAPNAAGVVVDVGRAPDEAVRAHQPSSFPSSAALLACPKLSSIHMRARAAWSLAVTSSCARRHAASASAGMQSIGC